ncbi:MAG TPA: glycoside hydrolase domain-containing protein [Longimicrobiales bacterium]|nr:glycoside hydrolase domain-containing protein [Longimicrobiales bacterium]
MRAGKLVLLAALTVAGVAGACAPLPVGGPVPARGVPGFDTRDYPGDGTMRRWFEASPYRWVGYYLPSPCYTGTTWTGRRSALRQMGWGFAVLYVGEQDWSAIRPLAADTAGVAVQGARCTTANLTADFAATHAAEAAAAASSDGFPDGTVIFLNVERVEHVSDALRSYIRAWAAGVLNGGRYLPGLYAHDHNASELFTVLAEEFVRHGRADRPRLWVARGAGFDVARAPVESGYAVAAVWQGRFDVRETWDDIALTIDVNVADSADPSRGR